VTTAYNQRPPVKDLAISPQELKDLFLFGVKLTDDNGCPFPESMYEFYIRSAQEWLEMELGGISITERVITNEIHDYYMNDYISYNFLKLFRFPVTEVTDVSIQFPLSSDILTFDPTWYRAESVSGQVNLVPTHGTFSSILIGQAGGYLPLLNQAFNIPAIMRVSYQVGFKKGAIPASIKEIIGMKAAMGPLNVAGDLIAGAGIASKSLNIDGLSQSISTTSSATNSGYGARILLYSKDIKDRLAIMRQYYRGIQMQVA